MIPIESIETFQASRQRRLRPEIRSRRSRPASKPLCRGALRRQEGFPKGCGWGVEGYGADGCSAYGGRRRVAAAASRGPERFRPGLGRTRCRAGGVNCCRRIAAPFAGVSVAPRLFWASSASAPGAVVLVTPSSYPVARTQGVQSICCVSQARRRLQRVPRSTGCAAQRRGNSRHAFCRCAPRSCRLLPPGRGGWRPAGGRRLEKWHGAAPGSARGLGVLTRPLARACSITPHADL